MKDDHTSGISNGYDHPKGGIRNYIYLSTITEYCLDFRSDISSGQFNYSVRFKISPVKIFSMGKDAMKLFFHVGAAGRVPRGFDCTDRNQITE